MQTIDTMRILSDDSKSLQMCIQAREVLITRAMAEKNIDLLKAISQMDKENSHFLHQIKARIADEIADLAKIKYYLE